MCLMKLDEIIELKIVFIIKFNLILFCEFENSELRWCIFCFFCNCFFGFII